MKVSTAEDRRDVVSYECAKYERCFVRGAIVPREEPQHNEAEKPISTIG